MKKSKKLLLVEELLGVKSEDEFDIVNPEGICIIGSPFYISELGLLDCDGNQKLAYLHRLIFDPEWSIRVISSPKLTEDEKELLRLLINLSGLPIEFISVDRTSLQDVCGLVLVRAHVSIHDRGNSSIESSTIAIGTVKSGSFEGVEEYQPYTISDFEL